MVELAVAVVGLSVLLRVCYLGRRVRLVWVCLIGRVVYW